MRSLTAIAAATALLLAACSGADSPDAGGDTSTQVTRAPAGDVTPATVDLDGQVTLAAALQPFGSCDDFLGHVQREASERVQPYGLPGTANYSPGGVILEDSAESAAADSDSAPAPTTTAPTAGATGSRAAQAQDGAGTGAGTDFSGTNVQVDGVDEPDLVKTDGRRIVALADGVLRIVDVTGTEPRLVGSLTLDDGTYPTDMFLSGDRVLLMASGWSGDVAVPFAESRIADIWGGGFPVARLVEVDLTDPAAPKVSNTLNIDGQVVSARLIGDVARVVTVSSPNGLDFEAPDSLRAEENALDANRQVISETTIDNWVPYYVLNGPDGEVVAEGNLVECDRAAHPPSFAGFTMLTVSTFDLAAGLSGGPVDATGVLGGGSTVYASPENLYVAMQDFVDYDAIYRAGEEAISQGEPAPAPPPAGTTIHRFDISDPAMTSYVASGNVPGYLLNQYSMDEADGRLRVATTTQPEWWPWQGDGQQQEQEQPESQLLVLEPDGNELVVAGQVGGLGKGERIYAVRFLRPDLAAVVTFRQVDPLYLIDLTDPVRPVVTGELKVNGYSAYLHPIGDHLLLGIGQDATEEGQRLGAQASVFDISDLANPTRVSQAQLGQGETPVEYDARAFLSWEPTGLNVVPVNQYASFDPQQQAGPTSWFGAVGLAVDDAGQITEVGRITHMAPPSEHRDCYDQRMPEKDLEWMRNEPSMEVTVTGEPDDLGLVQAEVCSTWFEEDYRAQVQRSVVVGDSLYLLSSKGLQRADLATLASTGLVEFPVPAAQGGGSPGRPMPIEG